MLFSHNIEQIFLMPSWNQVPTPSGLSYSSFVALSPKDKLRWLDSESMGFYDIAIVPDIGLIKFEMTPH